MKIKKYLTYHEIKYTYSQYYKICLKIAKDNKYKYTLDELDNKIYHSNIILIILNQYVKKNKIIQKITMIQ